MTKPLSQEVVPAAGSGSPETSDGSSRRSLLLGIAAGAVAAGSLASKAGAAEDDFCGTPWPHRKIRIVFDSRRAPSIEEVYKAVAAAADFAGCTSCGLGGLDLELAQEQILGPDPTPYIITSIPTPQPAGF